MVRSPGGFRLASGELLPGERREVQCVWSVPVQETLLRGLKSTGFAVKAIDGAGEAAVTDCRDRSSRAVPNQ